MAYKHREGSEAFAKQWDEAVERGTDTLEDTAMARAMNKSDLLMIFMLKALRPHKYNDKLTVTSNININVQKASEELRSLPRGKLLEAMALLQAPTIDNVSEENAD